MNVVDLTLKLCRLISTTGQEGPVVDAIESLFQNPDWLTRRLTVSAGRDNLLVVSAEGKAEILLTTHVDTVPPYYAPTMSEDGQCLLGRGVCDAKGIAAAMICAAFELRASGEKRVGLLFVVGEETNSDGAKAVTQEFVGDIRYFINGEPTDLKLVKATKGAVVFDLVATGKTGHSAYPDSGISAVHQLVNDVYRLLSHRWPSDSVLGSTTINVGKISGGQAGNQIAGDASATGVVRTTVAPEQVLLSMQSLLHPNTQIHVASGSSPQRLLTVEGFEESVVSFGTDVPYLSRLSPCLLIGPGSILDAHTDNEKVAVEDLLRAVDMYQELARKLLCLPKHS